MARVDPSKFEVQSANPLLSLGQIPLLDFGRRWNFRWDAWRSGFRLTPAALWGEDGRRMIRNLDEERILYKERKTLLVQIWGPPWSLGECFSSDHLQGVARRILIGKVCRSWGVRLSEELAGHEDELAFLSQRVEEAEQRLRLLRPRREALLEKLQQAAGFEQELADRQSELHHILESLESFEGIARPFPEETAQESSPEEEYQPQETLDQEAETETPQPEFRSRGSEAGNPEPAIRNPDSAPPARNPGSDF